MTVYYGKEYRRAGFFCFSVGFKRGLDEVCSRSVASRDQCREVFHNMAR